MSTQQDFPFEIIDAPAAQPTVRETPAIVEALRTTLEDSTKRVRVPCPDQAPAAITRQQAALNRYGRRHDVDFSVATARYLRENDGLYEIHARAVEKRPARERRRARQ